MHSYYAGTLNEMEKLWKRRAARSFLALAILIPTASALLTAFFRGGSGLLAGLGSDLPMRMLSLYTFALIPLFLFAAAADSFAGETAARTLKLMLVRPVARSKVYASKVTALAAGIALQLALVWIASTAAEWLVSGGDAAAGLRDSLIAYAAAFVPMTAIGLIAAFAAQGFASGAGAMSLMLVAYAAAKALPLAVPQISAWSVFSYTNWHVLWIGNGAPAPKLLNAFGLLVSYGLMAYAAGWMRFERKAL